MSTTPDFKSHFSPKAIESLLAAAMERNEPTTKVEEKPVEKKKPTIKLEDGEVLYSTLFGTPPSGRDHAVKVFTKTEWPESVRPFIPDLDKSYQFQPVETELLVVALVQGDKSFITGPTGSGKSSLVKNICAMLGLPFVRINFSGDMDSGAVFGTPTVKGGDVVWEDGPLTTLARTGGVCMCDEVSTAPAEVTMSMQWILEDDGKVFLKDSTESTADKMVTPHEMFRLVCTDNTVLQGDATGRYSGTNVQNTAFLDRFQTVIKLNYLEKKHEKAIIKASCPKLSASHIRDMLSLAHLVRSSCDNGDLNLTMSPRTLINWGRKTVYWGEPLHALRIAFFDKLEEDDQKTMNDLIHKIYNERIR